MTQQPSTQQRSAWICARSRVATFCAVILCGGLIAQAETRLGKPIDGHESLPISPAGAKRSTGTDATPGSSFAKTGAALSVVVVGIGVALTLARKFFPGIVADSPHRIIQVMGHAPLGTKGTVYVLRCGPRVLIVGGTTGQLTTLAEIADPDEIEEFVRLSGAKTPDARQSRPDSADGTAPTKDLKGQVDGMLDRIDTWKASG